MRRITRRTALLAAAALGLVSGLRADDAKVEGDLKKMQGAWVADNNNQESKWVFEGSTVKTNVQDMDYTCTIKLDPKAEPFATIDLAVTEGAGKGKTSKGIYKFDGEALVICVSMPGDETRPAEFKTVD